MYIEYYPTTPNPLYPTASLFVYPIPPPSPKGHSSCRLFVYKRLWAQQSNLSCCGLQIGLISQCGGMEMSPRTVELFQVFGDKLDSTFALQVGVHSL